MVDAMASDGPTDAELREYIALAERVLTQRGPYDRELDEQFEWMSRVRGPRAAREALRLREVLRDLQLLVDPMKRKVLQTKEPANAD